MIPLTNFLISDTYYRKLDAAVLDINSFSFWYVYASHHISSDSDHSEQNDPPKWMQADQIGRSHHVTEQVNYWRSTEVQTAAPIWSRQEINTEHRIRASCHAMDTNGQKQLQKTCEWYKSVSSIKLPMYEDASSGIQTLPRLAVNRTHSNSSPIFCRNSSTWGLFSTYTCRSYTDEHPFNGQCPGEPGLAGYPAWLYPWALSCLLQQCLHPSRRHFWSGKCLFAKTPRHVCPFDKNTARPMEFPCCSPSRLERASITALLVIH